MSKKRVPRGALKFSMFGGQNEKRVPMTPQIREFGVKVRRVFEALSIRSLRLRVREGSQGEPQSEIWGVKGRRGVHRGPQFR